MFRITFWVPENGLRLEMLFIWPKKYHFQQKWIKNVWVGNFDGWKQKWWKTFLYHQNGCPHFFLFLPGLGFKMAARAFSNS
jgi:hypothetical protein